MNWLKKLLGIEAKESKEKVAVETSEYIRVKKSEFHADMSRLYRQSRALHKKAVQTQVESVKLNKVVDDITHRIMIATGGQK